MCGAALAPSGFDFEARISCPLSILLLSKFGLRDYQLLGKSAVGHFYEQS